jgi:glutamine amidotransferase-like uncharacterized protein
MKLIKLFEEFNADALIGIYNDNGVVDSTISVWDQFFKDFFNKEPLKLDQNSFKKENFAKLDLLIIPGGDSFQERLGMSDQSIDDMVKWLKAGGKVVAVCAGFHLIAGGHDWSLDLLPVAALNSNINKAASDPTRRLTEEIVYIDFSVTDFGKKVLGTDEDIINLYFHGGPIITEKENNNFKVILKFAEEVPHQLQVPNFTKNAIAATYSEYGNGKIISISPHFEKTKKYRGLLANAIKYLLDK